jgi:hypothetical protein
VETDTAPPMPPGNAERHEAIGTAGPHRVRADVEIAGDHGIGQEIRGYAGVDRRNEKPGANWQPGELEP